MKIVFSTKLKIDGHNVFVLTEEEWNKNRSFFETKVAGWSQYDSSLIGMHIANCGFGIVDEQWLTAIDDEYLLGDVYDYIKKNF